MKSEHTYIYDGWNLIKERVTHGDGDMLLGDEVIQYAWGLDLSGSLQGAGGIGGLLARGSVSAVDDGDTNLWLYACDANGNVVQVMEADDATNVVAYYEYDPYGNIVSQSGDASTNNSFRFSSKYSDDETDLVYYGYRYYSPEMGRWLRRDPIGESGSLNLLAACLNACINYADALGLCLIEVVMGHGAGGKGRYLNEKINNAKAEGGYGDCRYLFPFACGAIDYYDRLAETGLLIPGMPKEQYWKETLSAFNTHEKFGHAKRFVKKAARIMCEDCKCRYVSVTFDWDDDPMQDLRDRAKDAGWIKAPVPRGEDKAGSKGGKKLYVVWDTVWLLDCCTLKWEIHAKPENERSFDPAPVP